MARRRFFTPTVVPQGMITSYLERELANWDWLKAVPKQDLIKEIGKFKFSASYDPFIHQLACMVIGIELPQFCYFLDMGAGKTALTLALFRWHQKHSGLKRCLVCVPKEVAVQSWLDEIEVHAPELTHVELLGGTEQRKALLEEEADLYLINYPGLQLLMSELVPVGKRKRKRQINPKLARAVAKRFGMVVLDESHRIGNSESLTYRECRYFTKHVPFRYALTGTPFGRDPTPLWAQFHVIDDGDTLGPTLGRFRAVFSNAKQAFWGGIEYTFDRAMEADLRRIIKHRSIYYRDAEFSDLPKLPPPKKVPCPFSVTAKSQYQSVVRQIKESHGDRFELKSAFVRMRMCTSGFLSVKAADDSNERLVQFFDENPKLEALEELIGDIPEDTKAMIFHDYIITGKMIQRLLTKLKLPYATLNGQTENPRAELRKFLLKPSVRFFVANSQSGSENINPQRVCSYAIFYETPVSPIVRRQAIKRLHREGQKKRVHIYDLVVPNSIDQKILDYLAEGKDLFESIIQGDKQAKAEVFA